MCVELFATVDSAVFVSNCFSQVKLTLHGLFV